MAKNRVIYQSDALFASKEVNSTGASDHVQLRRVQSANYSFNVARQDVNQFGQLARMEAIILEAPTVSFDASYLLGDGFNEQALGFLNGSGLNKGFISGQIALNPKNGKLITDDINKETTQVMENLKAILSESSLTFDNVVKTTIFLSSMDNFSSVNEIYGSYLGKDNAPARETVEVSKFMEDIDIECKEDIPSAVAVYDAIASTDPEECG